MPWQDNSGSDNNPNRRKNPWGSGPGGHEPPRGPGSVPPDLDDLLRRARQNFRDVIPGGGPFRYIGLAAVLALVLYFGSGFYFVQPNENAVVMTFGKYARTDENPGLKYAMPWPFQQVSIVDVSTERRLQIGFNDQTGGRVVPTAINTSDESLMLTGDENIIDIDFVILWRISNAKNYLFEIRDPEATIRIVAASAMREVIGKTNIQRALTDGRTKIQSDTRILMQRILDEYDAGVTINNVQLLKVDPPAQVVDAFNEVQRARQQKEELRNKAEAYRNDILPRARGESEKLRQEAEAYKQEVINRAKGDANRFSAVYESYRNAREVTAERMYIETIEQVLQNAKTIVLGSDKANNILPYLSLDQVRTTGRQSASLNDGEQPVSNMPIEPPQPEQR